MYVRHVEHTESSFRIYRLRNTDAALSVQNKQMAMTPTLVQTERNCCKIFFFFFFFVRVASVKLHETKGLFKKKEDKRRRIVFFIIIIFAVYQYDNIGS